MNNSNEATRLVCLEAAQKLRTYVGIYPGDKQARRLIDELSNIGTAAPESAEPSADRVKQTRYLDEIDGARVGEDWMDARQFDGMKREYVEDTAGRAPRVKWAALFDGYDKLVCCYLLTRDAMNYTQLTLVEVATSSAAKGEA
jgi:hypothetical protein